MTVEELRGLLNDSADKVSEARDVPPLDELLSQIATWMHIDQPGFAASDVRHMIHERKALIGTLLNVREALGDTCCTACKMTSHNRADTHDAHLVQE